MMKTGDHTRQVERLGASDWDTRVSALALLQAQGIRTLPALIAGTTHANWRVRRGCADLMDHLADDRCTSSLIRLLSDPVASVRRLALHALSCQGCKTCPLSVDIVGHLIACVSTDRSVRVRRAAVHQLGCQPPDARAAAYLHAFIAREHDPGLISRARWALIQHKMHAAARSQE